MVRSINKDLLGQQILKALGKGPQTGRELRDQLEVSQSTISRALKSLGSAVVHLGARRSTRYALPREIPGVTMPLPVYEIDLAGGSHRLGTLHAAKPENFFFEQVAPPRSQSYSDLPYFLEELRPGGYLGRLVPQRHEDLKLPSDIRAWNPSHTLSYLSQYAWDTIGNLIVGDRALELYLEHVRLGPQVVAPCDRQRRYPELADKNLELGPVGSSAVGEQPKFLTSVSDCDCKHRSVLVKFSPPRDSVVGCRIADLLVAEHLALETLLSGGFAAAHSEIVIADDRVFLEVTRFDRCGVLGRRGVISLDTLDNEFVGQGTQWSHSTLALAKLGMISSEHSDLARCIELFGGLIANTDMHGGNFAFFSEGTTLLAPTPVYDMGPALFAPTSNEIVDRDFSPPTPQAQDAPHWDAVFPLALRFWELVQRHSEVSSSFQSIAAQAHQQVAALESLGRLLPR